MTELRLAQDGKPTELFDRIRYDAAAEETAFHKLANLDVDGCRAAFAGLVERLDLSALGPADARKVILLLMDLLQKANRRIHRPATDDSTYQACRVELLGQFAACDTAEDARRNFLPALNRLLAPLVSRPRSSHPLVEQARAHIDQNYNHRLSLSSVATTLHLSPNYLSRVFRRETGVTMTAYIHRVRLEHAMMLLAAGNRSISEIAYLVGYQNYRDFYRNFVKYENASPRQMQRRLSPPVRA